MFPNAILGISIDFCAVFKYLEAIISKLKQQDELHKHISSVQVPYSTLILGNIQIQEADYQDRAACDPACQPVHLEVGQRLDNTLLVEAKAGGYQVSGAMPYLTAKLYSDG